MIGYGKQGILSRYKYISDGHSSISVDADEEREIMKYGAMQVSG